MSDQWSEWEDYVKELEDQVLDYRLDTIHLDSKLRTLQDKYEGTQVLLNKYEVKLIKLREYVDFLKEQSPSKYSRALEDEIERLRVELDKKDSDYLDMCNERDHLALEVKRLENLVLASINR